MFECERDVHFLLCKAVPVCQCESSSSIIKLFCTCIEKPDSLSCCLVPRFDRQFLYINQFFMHNIQSSYLDVLFNLMSPVCQRHSVGVLCARCMIFGLILYSKNESFGFAWRFADLEGTRWVFSHSKWSAIAKIIQRLKSFMTILECDCLSKCRW